MSGTAAKYLGEMLKTNRAVTSLSVAQNTIDTEGGQALARSLVQNQTLTKLDLRHNCLGPGAGSEFGEALQQNSVLQVLHLDCNNLQDEGVTALVAGIQKAGMRGIRELHIAKNGFGPMSERALIRLVRSPRASLRILDSKANSLSLSLRTI